MEVLVLVVFELPPDGFGVTTTGAGAAVLVTGGADWVVADGACVVVDVVFGATGLGLWWTTLRFLAGSAVVVCEVVLVAGVDAACVVEDVVLDAVPPPQPANAMAIAIVLSISFFISPAPIFATRGASPQITRHLGSRIVPVGIPPNSSPRRASGYRFSP